MAVDYLQEQVREICNLLLETGELFAHLIDDCPEGTPVSYYWDCMEKVREISDTLIPPQGEWPVNVIPLAGYKKQV
jgi:hypothetical protein